MRIVCRNKAGKEKSTKVAFEGKQSGNPILLLEKIFAVVVAKPSITVLGYMKGCRKILLRNFGTDRQLLRKSVLGIVEGFLRNFYHRVYIFTYKCAWLYVGTLKLF